MLLRLAGALLATTLLSGCLIDNPRVGSAGAAILEPQTKTTISLQDLPAPKMPVPVAVYEFPDLTGQAKPNPEFAEYSRAVTQGAASILIDVLTQAGGGKWFNVTERSGLKDLVQERTLYENTAKAYQTNLPVLPPVRFAGIILEGGIVGYDSDMITGGYGAKFFGIGGDTQYRSDTVTVNIRAVSVKTGQVMASATTSKDIYSFEGQGGSYVFTSPDHLLEIEAGFSRNDPGQLAVREALELAVYSLIMDGLRSNLWSLADPSLTQALLDTYNANYNSVPREVAAAAARKPDIDPKFAAAANAPRPGTPAYQ